MDSYKEFVPPFPATTRFDSRIPFNPVNQEHPLHVVYALTSSGNDIYSAMTRASILSLRHWNPEVHITICCDHLTTLSLAKTGDPVTGFADRIITLETPDAGASYRNRFLKTTMGSVITTPFLYLDSDTLIRRNLEYVPQLASAHDLGAAVNNSGLSMRAQIHEKNRAIIAANGWKSPRDGYYNSGVIWFSGTPASIEFAKEWHARWLTTATSGIFFDQPAFNACLVDLNPRFLILPTSCNAQFKRRPSACIDAGVWHYFASSTRPGSGCRQITEIEDYICRPNAGTSIDEGEIIRIATMKYPWTIRSRMDRVVAGLISRQDRPLTKSAVYWLEGRRFKAMRRWVRQGLRKLIGKSPENHPVGT